MILTYVPLKSILGHTPQSTQGKKKPTPISVIPGRNNTTFRYVGGHWSTATTQPEHEYPVLIPQNQTDLETLIEAGHNGWHNHKIKEILTENRHTQQKIRTTQQTYDDICSFPLQDAEAFPDTKTILQIIDSIQTIMPGYKLHPEQNILAFYAVRILERYIDPFKEWYEQNWVHAVNQPQDHAAPVHKAIRAVNDITLAILKTNQKLCKSATNKYRPMNEHILDHEDVCFETYLDAILGFDPSLGFTFSTYLYKAIQRRYSTENKTQSRQRGTATISLDAERARQDTTLHNMLASQRHDTFQIVCNMEKQENLKQIIFEALKELTPNQRHVILARMFCHEYEAGTQQEIGTKLKGLTRQRINQIENEAREELTYHIIQIVARKTTPDVLE